MQKTFRRDFQALPEIFDFITEFVVSEAIDECNGFPIELIVEELFTNMVKYNAGGTSEIGIGLARQNDHITITLTDRDVDPFDITKVSDVDMERQLAEKKVGGLGLHFVRNIAESISYDYEDRCSVVTVTKRVEAENA